MTLLDAPVFDEVRDRRNRVILWGGVGFALVLFIGGWLISGMPVDFPWNWPSHFSARITVNRFLTAVEKNDLPKAYGIWMHDPDWQKHPDPNSIYPFSRFEPVSYTHLPVTGIVSLNNICFNSPFGVDGLDWIIPQ